MTAGFLTPGSSRFAHAQVFAKELRTAMLKRRMRPFHIYKAAGGGYSALMFDCWISGRSLPRLDRALRLSEALDWPRLAEIVRTARTGTCERPGCGRTFISESGKTRKYCSARCRQLVHDYDLRFTHATRKKISSDDLEHRALAFIAEDNVMRDELQEHRLAIASMCDACEPEGYCRTPDCPLRTISPLPLKRAQIIDRRAAKASRNRWSFPGVVSA